MNLLDLMVKVGIDDQASSHIGKIGDSVKSGLGSAAKAGAAAMAAVGAAAVGGAVALGKASLDAYASYEQLSGGVEKLFGDASGTVLGFAQEAYKTTGMSANQYMEQVTSFSAALIGSLGGDTEAAAQQADVAMRAISDNVNVFGSNMEDVQNAFQGFAKQNYTMLDNLKLGYGGTKSEMERLIADANAYAEANGQAADLSIESFSDIVTAIELIQEKQGIAGTTAREAATTIEGSINMTKAAWQNLLAEFGKDDGEVGARMTELVDSAMAAFNNIMPRVQIIFESVATALPTFMPMLLDALNTALPTLLDAITQTLPGVLEALVTTIQTIAEQIPQLVATLVPVLISLAPVLLEAALQMFLGILNALAQSGPELTNSLIDTIMAMAELLVQYAPQILDAGHTLFAAIITALLQRAPEIIGKLIEMVGELIGSVVGSVGDMLAAGGELIGGLLSAIGDAAGDLVGKMGEILDGMIRSVGDFFWDLFNAGADLIQGLIDGIGSAIGGVGDAIMGGLGGAVDGVLNFLGIHSPSKLFKWIGDMTMDGLSEGIEETAKDTEKAMRKAAEGVYRAADGEVNLSVGATANGSHKGLAVGSGVSIIIEKMEVRDDRDIGMIADELHRLMSRQSGGALWSSSYSTA